MTPTTDPRPEQIRQIAEKVMGWRWNTIGLSGSYWVNCLRFDPFLTATHTEMLMDRMRELGWWLTLKGGPSVFPDEGPVWEAVWTSTETMRAASSEPSTDWRTAACLAALEVMNAE